jgi:hypothetical protein
VARRLWVDTISASIARDSRDALWAVSEVVEQASETTRVR